MRRLLDLPGAVPLLMLLVAAAARGFAFVPAVIDTDEGLYLLQARAWREGGWPFLAVWDMHPPGAPALFMLAFAVFGESVLAVRLLGVIAVAATASLLVAIARALGAGRAAALAAGLLYAGQSSLLSGLATNTEILFAPFVTAALLIAVRAAGDGGERAIGFAALAAMGLLIGFALLIKQVVVFEGCFAFAVAVLPALVRRRLTGGGLVGRAIVYAVACGLPTALLFAGYAAMGAAGVLWDALVLAPLRYQGDAIPPEVRFWAITTPLVTLLPAIGLALVATVPPRRADGTILLFGWVWLSIASLAIAAPGMYFLHYFLIALPPLSLLGGLGAVRVVLSLRAGAPGVAWGVVVAVVAGYALRDEALYRLRSGAGLWRPDPVREVARVLAAELPPRAPVLMANYHVAVLFLARLEPASRFVFPAQLTGHYAEVLPVDADEELARILASRPAAIVIDRGWMHVIRAEALAAIEAALAEAYERAAAVPEERGPVEIWRLRASAR
ncbi:glycosyltransferase family 39 protein [Elioraea thermophila]|uniref:glycosyltransferase family 39 protein n=1 Tax=Elioraea thermophila TaxID=2185104 RepID=UPI001300678E|nr:glycosyltransferase family 39 protein [Elioraea thermophila]